MLEDYKTLEIIPTGFWRSEVLTSLPVNFTYRRNTCRRIVDSEHWKMCKLLEGYYRAIDTFYQILRVGKAVGAGIRLW